MMVFMMLLAMVMSMVINDADDCMILLSWLSFNDEHDSMMAIVMIMTLLMAMAMVMMVVVVVDATLKT